MPISCFYGPIRERSGRQHIVSRRSRTFQPDVSCALVLAQALVNRLPHQSVSREREIGDLDDKLGPHPRPACERNSASLACAKAHRWRTKMPVNMALAALLMSGAIQTGQPTTKLTLGGDVISQPHGAGSLVKQAATSRKFDPNKGKAKKVWKAR